MEEARTETAGEGAPVPEAGAAAPEVAPSVDENGFDSAGAPVEADDGTLVGVRSGEEGEAEGKDEVEGDRCEGASPEEPSPEEPGPAVKMSKEEGEAGGAGEEGAALELEAQYKAVLEALLFSSSAPVTAAKLSVAAGIETGRVRKLLSALKEEYDRDGRGFALEEIAGGYQLLTRSRFFPFVQKLQRSRASDKLTQAQMETLAIVAYKQPIIRADVEAIRGVQSGQILRSLLDHRLIRVVGRDERLGRPLLYGTTRRFLEVFGLKSLKELPTLEELRAL